MHNCQNGVNVRIGLIHFCLAELPAGACFTLNHCLTPFVDGLFCTQAEPGTTIYAQVGVYFSSNQRQMTSHDICTNKAGQCVYLCLVQFAVLSSL